MSDPMPEIDSRVPLVSAHMQGAWAFRNGKGASDNPFLHGDMGMRASWDAGYSTALIKWQDEVWVPAAAAQTWPAWIPACGRPQDAPPDSAGESLGND